MIQADQSIPARRSDLVFIMKNKRTCHPVDFAIPANHRVKMEESKKINKYMNLLRELWKAMDMKEMPIIAGALGTIPKGLVRKQKEQEIRGRIKTRRRRVAGIGETCCHLDSNNRPTVKTAVKKLAKYVIELNTFISKYYLPQFNLAWFSTAFFIRHYDCSLIHFSFFFLFISFIFYFYLFSK